MSNEVKAPEASEIPLLTTANDSPKPPKVDLTVMQLKASYAFLPDRFFEIKMSPVQFGFWCLEFFKSEGLKSAIEVPATPVLGYAFCTALSPVQIAVYGYYCYNGHATIKEVGVKRKLPEILVKKTREELLELGLLVETDGALVTATLKDLLGDLSDGTTVSTPL